MTFGIRTRCLPLSVSYENSMNKSMPVCVPKTRWSLAPSRNVDRWEIVKKEFTPDRVFCEPWMVVVGKQKNHITARCARYFKGADPTSLLIRPLNMKL